MSIKTGKDLRAFRARHGLSASQLAKELGISRHTVRMIEKTDHLAHYDVLALSAFEQSVSGLN